MAGSGRRSSGGAADQDPGVAPARHLGERVRVRARDGLRRGSIAVVRATELEVLGKRHQPRAAGGRLVGQGYRTGDIGRDVTGRIELDKGDRQVHRAMVRRVSRSADPGVVGEVGRRPLTRGHDDVL
jgi:hypothetical protein